MQSFELYDEIYRTHNKVSSAMLLKMAFVKEGLGDYSNALYYLNLYYLKTYDKKVLKKMENLAEKHKLSGYDYNDTAFFLNIYYKYRIQIDLFIVCLALLLLGVLIFQKRKKKTIQGLPAYAFLTLLVLLLVVNNFGREREKAIITSPHTYLMDGPSPGSNVIDVVSGGHRVKIIGKKDVWVEITWNHKNAYVKEFDLKPIVL